MPGSRISVEVVGSSSELQAAVAKAADSLKGLGGVLAKQTDIAMAAGDKTVRMNETVARSYRTAALAATSSSKEAAVSYTRSAGQQTAASERVTRAMEAQARAATLSARQQVRANDLAAASAARLAARQEASAAKTRAAFGAQSSELTRMGRTLSAGLLGAAAASTYLAVKFQSNTTRLETQAGATAKQVDKLRKGILDMASQVGFVPNQLADGMYHVVSSMNAVLPASQRVSGELKILKIAAEGAQIGHSSLEETTYALASAMNALHSPVSDASKVMGELNSIVGAGDMTMTDLLEALKSGLIPAAQTFHVSLQSVGAALAVMGDMGMRGSLAGTRLRMSLALLGAPSEKAAKYLTAIGMSSKEATARTHDMRVMLDKAGLSITTLQDDLKKPNGLSVALQDLNHHLQASGLSANASAALISHAFGGGRSGAAIQLMAQNTDRLNLKFKQIGDGAAGFGKAWATTQHTLAFELKQTEATAVALATKLGTDLIPVVHDLLGDLKDMVHWFEQNHAAVVGLEVVLGTFAAVTIGSFFVSQIRKAIGLARDLKSALTFGSVMGPKVLPGGGAGAAGAARTVTTAERTAAGGFASTLRTGLAGAFRGLAIGGIGTMLAQQIGGAIHGAAGVAVKQIGTDASIGAGIGSIFGPAGMAGGALIGGLLGSLKFFVGHDAEREGVQFADKFTANLPGKVSNKVKEGLAHAATTAINTPKAGTPAANAGNIHLGGLQADLKGGQNPTILAAQFQKSFQRSFAAFFNLGYEGAHAVVRGLQSVKFPTQGILINDFMMKLHRLPTQAQPEAAKLMLQYAEGLAQQGKLPRRAVDSMIASIEQAFPGLQSYLMQQGAASGRQLAVSMKFNAATSQLKQTLANYRQQFGDWSIATKITGQNIDANVGLAMTHLKNIVRTSTGDTRKQASAELEHLRTQVNSTFTQMGTQVALKTAAMKDSIVHGSAKAAIAAITNFSKFEQAVESAMKGGALSASEGMRLIAVATDQVIASLGGQKIPIPALIHAQQITSKFSQGKTGVAGVLTAAAGGGFIGQPGEKGQDAVPIVVGRGEAVLNHSQQRVVNAALAAQGIGGLPEVFSKVTRPHYMAQGGYASGGLTPSALLNNPGTGTKASPTGGYVYPFPGLTPGRLDQGFDLSGAGNVGAIGPGVVLRNTEWPGWPGDGGVVYRLTAGPRAGSIVYVMEDFHASVPVGATLSPGQVIGRAWGGPSAIEAGWANASGTGPLTPYNGAADGTPMPGGIDFKNFVQGLAHGVLTGGGSFSGVAAPTWKDIIAPGVSGKGAIAQVVRSALKKATDAANAYGRRQVGALGVAGGGAMSVGGSVQKQIAAALASVGFNKIAIAGIMGNISQESGYNPNDPGGGLFQFTPRKAGDNGSVAEQVNLMMSSGGAGIVGAMNAQGSPAAAAAYFMNNFERPGIPALGNRIAGANAAFAAGYARGGYASGGNVWRVPYSDEDASSGSGWTELSTNGNAAAKSGHPHTASHTGGWDFATLGRMYPKGTQLRIQAMSGKVGTFPLTDFGDGSAFAPAIGLTPAVRSYLNPTGGVVDISLPSGNINLASGFGRLVSGGSASSSSGSTNAASKAKPKPIVAPPVAIPYERNGRLVGTTPPYVQPRPHAKPGHLGAVYGAQGTLRYVQQHHGVARLDQVLKTAGEEKLTDAFKIIPDPQGFLDGVKDPFSDWVTALDNQYGLIGSILGETDANGNPHATLLGSNGPPSDISLLNPKPGNLSAIKGIKWPTYAAGSSAYDAETMNRMTEVGVLQGKVSSESAAVGMLGKAIKDRQGRQKAIGTFLAQQAARRVRLQEHRDRVQQSIRDLTSKDLRKRLAAAVSSTATGKNVADAKVRVADAEDSIGHYEKLIASERARGKGQDRSLIRGWQGKIADERTFIRHENQYISKQRKTAPTSVSSAMEKIAKNDLSNENVLLGKEIGQVGKVLSQLGGSSTRAGTGGLYGTITTDLKTLSDGAKTFTDDIALTMTSTIPGLDLSLRDIGAAKLGQSATGGADTSLLLSLTQQENLQLASALALNQSQTRALASIIPEIPRYKDGGATREGLSYLHNDEYVVPEGGALVSRGGGPTIIQLTIENHGSAGEIMRMIDQRVQHDGNVRVISKKIGQRTSMLAGAPGGGR